MWAIKTTVVIAGLSICYFLIIYASIFATKNYSFIIIIIIILRQFSDGWQLFVQAIVESKDLFPRQIAGKNFPDFGYWDFLYYFTIIFVFINFNGLYGWYY